MTICKYSIFYVVLNLALLYKYQGSGTTAALLGTEKRFGRKHRTVMFLRCPSLNCFFDAELEFLQTHYFKMLEDKYVEYSVHTSLKQRFYEIGLTITRGKILGNSSLASSSAIYYNAE